MAHLLRTIERERWLALIAIAWGLASFLAWLGAWRWSAASFHNEAALTVLALSALALGVCLRLIPTSVTHQFGLQTGFAARENDTSLERDLLWLGVWTAQLNALGVISVIAPSLLSILPALAVTALVEGWLLRQAPFTLTGLVSPPATEQTIACHPDSVDDTSDEPSAWLRRSIEGQSPEGDRYLSGWVRFELAAGQKSAHLVVGFSPTFMVAPEIELDEEGDDAEQSAFETTGLKRQARDADDDDRESDAMVSACAVEVEHATAAGMRVTIKRRTAALPYRGKLLWHAAPPPMQPTTPAALLGRLP